MGEKVRKRGKSGRKGQNREGSFTLPLLTNRAGYATGPHSLLLNSVQVRQKWHEEQILHFNFLCNNRKIAKYL